MARVRVLVPDLRATTERAFRSTKFAPRDAEVSGRYLHRKRKLTPAQEAAVRSLAATKSLRSLAADFAVSHETIRSVIRASESARPTHTATARAAGIIVPRAGGR